MFPNSWYTSCHLVHVIVHVIDAYILGQSLAGDAKFIPQIITILSTYIEIACNVSLYINAFVIFIFIQYGEG